MRHEAIFNNRVHLHGHITYHHWEQFKLHHKCYDRTLYISVVKSLMDQFRPTSWYGRLIQSYSIWTFFRRMKGRWWGHPSYYQIIQCFNVVFMKKVCYIYIHIYIGICLVQEKYGAWLTPGKHLSIGDRHWCQPLRFGNRLTCVTIHPSISFDHQSTSGHQQSIGSSPPKKMMPYISIIQ